MLITEMKDCHYEKIFLQKNLYRDKGPRSYIGPWALSKDIKRSEDKQIMIKDSQTKLRKKRATIWPSKEYILLGLIEYGSKYIA